ncbi:MAG TPA: hypothetical protein VGD60_07705 [Candidatus Acidoferrales bacterium]
MKSRISSFKADVGDAAGAAEVFLPFPSTPISRVGAPGLSSHVRQLHRANRGLSRWILFALFGGAVAAFAIVHLAIL